MRKQCSTAIIATGPLLAGLLLSACGGGGGGGDSSTPTTPPAATQLTIGAANYQAVAQVALSSTLFLQGAGDIAVGAQTTEERALLQTSIDLARRALAQRPGGPGVALGAELRETLLCAQGGSLLLTLNDQGRANEFDTGDSLTLDAQSCREDGDLINGRLVLSLQALTGVFDSNNFSSTLQMTMSAFAITSGSDTIRGEGSLGMQLSATPAGIGEAVLTISSLSLSGTEGGVNFSHRLSDARFASRTEPSGVGTRTLVSASATLSSSAFDNKQLRMETAPSFVIQGSDFYPSSGQMMVRGGEGSQLRLSALNSSQVRLELDANGDGNYETQLTKTWAELE